MISNGDLFYKQAEYNEWNNWIYEITFWFNTRTFSLIFTKMYHFTESCPCVSFRYDVRFFQLISKCPAHSFVVLSPLEPQVNWDIIETILKFYKFQYGPYCMVHKTFLSGLHSLFSTFCDACDVQIDTFPRNKLSSNCSLIIIGLLATRRESFDSISGRFHVTEQTDPLSAQFLKCLSFQASTDRLGQKNRNQSK